MADDTTRRTDSGIEIKPQYTAGGPRGRGVGPRAAALGDAGTPPYTRGVYEQMYRTRPWTMRQYSGFGTAAETNERFHFLLGAGQTGLSLRLRPAHPDGLRLGPPPRRGRGRQGRRGDRLARGHGAAAPRPPARHRHHVDDDQLDRGDPAALLRARRREAGRVDAAKIGGTIQNDLLKEYVARGTYIYPPRPSMRIITDIFAYCREQRPEVEHDLDLRLPHPRSGQHRGAGDRVHAVATRSRTCRPRSTRASTSTSSRRASRSSGTGTTTSSRRSRSSGPRAACGTGS